MTFATCVLWILTHRNLTLRTWKRRNIEHCWQWKGTPCKGRLSDRNVLTTTDIWGRDFAWGLHRLGYAHCLCVLLTTSLTHIHREQVPHPCVGFHVYSTRFAAIVLLDLPLSPWTMWGLAGAVSGDGHLLHCRWVCVHLHAALRWHSAARVPPVATRHGQSPLALNEPPAPRPHQHAKHVDACKMQYATLLCACKMQHANLLDACKMQHASHVHACTMVSTCCYCETCRVADSTCKTCRFMTDPMCMQT